jgi:hypothetical protein
MNTAATSALAFTALAFRPATPVASAPAAKPTFDGNWSVLIVTEKGDCDRAYRYAVRINADGSVNYAGTASFTVSGKVQQNGAVIVTVARGNQSATGSGKLSLTDGSGTWTGGPCSGTWTAERRS